MISGRDIVVIATQAWDIKIGSNCKNIAVELSKHNRVLYVDPPLDRKTRWLNRHEDEVKKRLAIIAGRQPALTEVMPGLWNLFPNRIVESINWLPHAFPYHQLNKRNNSLFAACVRDAINKLGFTDYIIFNDSAMFHGFYAPEMLKPLVSIYYIRDNLITQPYFARHGADLEPELAAKYDAVVSNSVFLAKYLKAYNPNTHMVGQGCDLSIFDPTPGAYTVPDDMKSIPGPVVGYIGFLTSLRLDIDLLLYLSEHRPNMSLVLVGPEDDDFKNSELHRRKNVFFLGGKKEHELGQYLSQFDVAINPQLVNGMTIGNYPRKIDEYLAMGKPSVATRTEAMEYFGDNVYLSTSHAEFAACIDQALREDNDERRAARIACAREHTWEKSVERIGEVMEEATRRG